MKASLMLITLRGSALLVALASARACAQPWPNKPVRVVESGPTAE